MRIQKIIKIGIFAGLLAYGCKACESLNRKLSEDLIGARENAKVFLKQSAPNKYDSLMNAGLGEVTKPDGIKAWLDTENQVLDSLNNTSIYNKALLNMQNAAKDTLKRIK